MDDNYDPDKFLESHVGEQSGYIHCRAFRRTVDVEGKTYLTPHEKIPDIGSLEIDSPSRSSHSTPGGDWHESMYYFDKPSICEFSEHELRCREMTENEIKSGEGR